MFERFTTRRTPSEPKEPVAKELKLTFIETGWSCRLRHPLIIGRGADCDLLIDDAQIGRRHAEIYPVGAQWWIRDLGSDNGTFMRGEIVEAEPFGTPSEIRLGADGPTLRLDSLNGAM